MGGFETQISMLIGSSTLLFKTAFAEFCLLPSLVLNKSDILHEQIMHLVMWS